MLTHHIDTVATGAQYATYTATASTVVFWGLHISDIAVIVSSLASVSGVGLQIFLAVHRLRRLERRQDAHIQVTKAVSGAVRALDKEVKGKE